MTELIGHRTVTEASVETFGALTGDYARIHFDHELGRQTPAGRGFAHGLLGASWALGMLTRHMPSAVGAGDPQAVLRALDVRFERVVHFGDTLALAVPEPPTASGASTRTAFRLLNQGGDVVTTGSVTADSSGGRDGGAPPAPPGGEEPWELSPPPPGPEGAWTAEDILASGPRGSARVRTLTEADVVAWTGFCGETNPQYLNAPFAESSVAGARTVPPMLCFCLGFSVWLETLLRLPMAGDERSAGHLGDRWRAVAPVYPGDTLELRHRPLALRRTRSRPDLGVATFGLQLLDQRARVVQQGEVDMMLPMRDAGD